MDFEFDQTPPQIEDSNSKLGSHATEITNLSPSKSTLGKEHSPLSKTKLAREKISNTITIDKANLPPPYPLQPNNIKPSESYSNKKDFLVYNSSNNSTKKSSTNSDNNTPNSTPSSHQRKAMSSYYNDNRSIYETSGQNHQINPGDKMRRSSGDRSESGRIPVTYSECVNPLSHQTSPIHPSTTYVSRQKENNERHNYENCICSPEDNKIFHQNLCHHHQQLETAPPQSSFQPSLANYQPNHFCVHNHTSVQLSNEPKRFSGSFRTSIVEIPMHEQISSSSNYFTPPRNPNSGLFNRKYTNYSASAEAMILIHPFSCERLAILAIISTLTCLATLLTGAIFYIWILPR